MVNAGGMTGMTVTATDRLETTAATVTGAVRGITAVVVDGTTGTDETTEDVTTGKDTIGNDTTESVLEAEAVVEVDEGEMTMGLQLNRWAGEGAMRPVHQDGEAATRTNSRRP